MTPPTSILCPGCWRRTYNPRDVARRYCSLCGFHDDLQLIFTTPTDAGWTRFPDGDTTTHEAWILPDGSIARGERGKLIMAAVMRRPVSGGAAGE
jgi:hypothetical protein